MARFCDADIIGHRRQRALVGGSVTAAFMLGAWVSLLWFLGSRHINRSRKPWEVDIWSGRNFADPLAVLILVGFSFATFLVYGQWVFGTLTNRPTTLSRFSGFFEAMRAVGLAVAFDIDSHNTPFPAEAATYFALIFAGLALSVYAVLRYTTHSRTEWRRTWSFQRCLKSTITGCRLASVPLQVCQILTLSFSKEDDATVVY